MDKGEKVAVLSISVNLILFGIKYVFADFSGSIALKAEAFHSLTDVVASCTVFIGLIISKRKTRSFPYGLYKVENLVSVVVAFAIFYAAYEIVIESLQSGTSDLQNIGPTIASVLCAIAITFAFSRYELKVGREIRSPSLVADAQHISVDMLANAAVLAALASHFAGIDLDRIIAFVIVALIVWSGGKILIDGIRVLLDASLDFQTLSQAEKLMLAEPQVSEIQHLTGRNSGPYKFIEAAIVLKTHDLEKAHFIAQRIESSIIRQIRNVDRVLIHYEPVHKEHLIYAFPLANAEEQKISRHFGEAPCFALIPVRIKDSTASGRTILENPFTHVDHGKGILVSEYLNKHAVDVVVTRESFEGKGPYYVFSSAGVENIVTEKDNIDDVFKEMNIRSLNPASQEMGKDNAG